VKHIDRPLIKRVYLRHHLLVCNLQIVFLPAYIPGLYTLKNARMHTLW